jgi:ubiquinone/menaquinone biosynthesis C-methylase UbiE
VGAKNVIDFWGNGWSKRLAEPEHKFLFALDKNGIQKYADQSLANCNSTKTLMSVISAQCLEGAIALNVGCGAETEAITLARGGATCIAMDITVPAAADSLLRKLGAGEKVQGDARFIPIESESVDIIYSSGVLHHSTDLPKSVAEIYRVLINILTVH